MTSSEPRKPSRPQKSAKSPPPDDPNAGSLPAAFRWALESTADPTRAACDWLAAEIVAGAPSAAVAVTSTETSLESLIALKVAFKALRQNAESATERNRAARLYAASIAAALVRFGLRITQQRDAALHTAFRALADDESMDEPLRDIAAIAARRVVGGSP